MIPPLTGVRGSAPRPLLHGAQGSAPPTAGRGCKWVRRNAPAQASKKLFFEWYRGHQKQVGEKWQVYDTPSPAPLRQGTFVYLYHVLYTQRIIPKRVSWLLASPLD